MASLIQELRRREAAARHEVDELCGEIARLTERLTRAEEGLSGWRSPGKRSRRSSARGRVRSRLMIEMGDRPRDLASLVVLPDGSLERRAIRLGRTG
jgi:hypothetical protein